MEWDGELFMHPRESGIDAIYFLELLSIEWIENKNNTRKTR